MPSYSGGEYSFGVWSRRAGLPAPDVKQELRPRLILQNLACQLACGGVPVTTGAVERQLRMAQPEAREYADAGASPNSGA